MVFFVCEGCNESLKKNKVDAHAARCRNCWAVSCVDCSVVFEGNDYAAHTSCVSEAQKYEGGLYKAKAKKMTPQERWVEVVTNGKALSSPNDKKLQNVLDRVAAYDNVPRKKAKYVNFMKNSIGIMDAETIEKVWVVFEDAYKKSEEAYKQSLEDAAKDTATNGSDTVDTNGKDKKRSKQEEEAEEKPVSKKAKKAAAADSDNDEPAEATEAKPIKWSKLIKAALKKAPLKQCDLQALGDQLIQQIRDNKLSTKKSDKELLKEFNDALQSKFSSSKVAIVQVVRLAE